MGRSWGGMPTYLSLTAENQQLQAPVWETRWTWLQAPEQPAQGCPGCPPRGPCGGPRTIKSAPEAGNGNKTVGSRVRVRKQRTYSVRLGSKRVAPIAGEVSWGRLPSCSQSQEQMWAVPRSRVPEKPRSLRATGFQWRRGERGGGERGGGGGGGGYNWETEV